ncbi:hypothetical protein CGC20_31150 [Leishmania donovani]|uniref:ABCA1-4-like C-terminal R2 regulatory domain-containing protein n=1 Tax=Leishmania donovani TaxID=5661 RepID=A0A504WTI2_LEIDO|nr:hypothetical protein CGC20_31150 [Leishmania donovani]
MHYALMLYLDAAVPQECGTPKHAPFFITEPVRWCCGSSARVLEGGVNETHLTGAQALSDYLLDTWYVHDMPRYGAVSCIDRNVTALLRFADEWRGTNVNVLLYNSSSHHQAGLNLATYYDLFIKSFLGRDSAFMRYKVELFNEPASQSQLGFIVVFLDEPSAGMDPVARRGMWTAIQRAAGHCSVVLTTHHLEEVEALADIVAIMVRGYVRCVGDKVHLKNKFGSAFEVSVRLASAQHAELFASFMQAAFPDAVRSEGEGRRLVYQLPRDRGFGDVFQTFQANKEQLHITATACRRQPIRRMDFPVFPGVTVW